MEGGCPRQRNTVKYNGVILRRSDIAIFEGPFFFNDRIIDFYLTHLDAYMNSDALLILPPSITLWIKHTSEDIESLEDLLERVQLPRRKVIIFPVINEGKNVKSTPKEDERHWSLLVFVRSRNAFMHFDSSKENMNGSDAEQVCKVLRPYVSLSASEYDFATYIEYHNTPKQDDDEPWNCGVYVLAFARIICRCYNQNGPDNITDDRLWFRMIEGIKPSYISLLRHRIMEIFKRLLNRRMPCVCTKNYMQASMATSRIFMEEMGDEILKEDVVLTYNGIEVRLDDFDSLEEPSFITDRAIEFYFSYLSSSINSDEILLVPPSIIFWLKDSPHDEESLEKFPDPLTPLNLSQREIIIFPLINENKKISSVNGGNHWSLLVFEKSTNVFVHHDSSEKTLNKITAECMYQVLCPYVLSESESEFESDNPIYVEYTGTPTQEEPSECGVYVLAITKAICTWYTSRSGSSGSSSSSAAKNTDNISWFSDVRRITPSLISSLRLDVQKLIVCLGGKQP